jgi:tRNA-dihydrouridine synthase
MQPATDPNPRLPWKPGTFPLMLAPMQGLTNSALRSLIIDLGKPDLIFTEFLRVSTVSRKRFSRMDKAEITAAQKGVPLVVQLVGHGVDVLVDAARVALKAGARHINLNLGCPYGRMTTAATGGALLQHPNQLQELLPALRDAIPFDFSVKIRGGYEDPMQIFTLLPLLEKTGIDWLALHPRTVVQKYAGDANHRITAELVRETSLPVIANGDIRSAAEGQRILQQTGAAGLMIGRAAIADPLLFSRLRGTAPASPDRKELAKDLKSYLKKLMPLYQERFCGEKQVLDKIKNVLIFVDVPEFSVTIKKLQKCKLIGDFLDIVETL